jgi:hypothetical protein
MHRGTLRMSSPPGILPPPYEHLQSIYDRHGDKKLKLTKNSSPDDVKHEQERRAGQAMFFVVVRGKDEDLNRIGLPEPDRMFFCDGAHAVNNPCVHCGWGLCRDKDGAGCNNSFKGSFGWNTMCKGCDPYQAPPPTAVISSPTVIVPAASTASSKKARGRAKRAKKGGGGLGGFGGDPSSASEPEEEEPEEEPEEDDPNDIWGPIPAPAGKTKPRPKATKKAAVKPKGGKPAAPEAGGKIDLTSITDEEGGGKKEERRPQTKGKGLPHDYPADWTNKTLNPLGCEFIEVKEGSDEYTEVVNAYTEGLLKGHEQMRHSEKYNSLYEASYMKSDIKFAPLAFKVLKIERIQNLPKLRAYNVFKNFITENMQYRPQSERVKECYIEETVYHGTSEDSALKIAKKGFNRTETSNHAFGYGAYFDVYGQLSMHHATLGRSGEPLTGCVVVARFATGRLTQTQSSAKDVPDGFDCGASGNDRNAWMRVSFSDAQSYAKYIIYIERIPAKV